MIRKNFIINSEYVTLLTGAEHVGMGVGRGVHRGGGGQPGGVRVERRMAPSRHIRLSRQYGLLSHQLYSEMHPFPAYLARQGILYSDDISVKYKLTTQ